MSKGNSEPVLEPVLRNLRFGIAKEFLNRNLQEKMVILDYGCGKEPNFYYYLRKKNLNFRKYVGYDPLLGKEKEGKDFLVTSELATVFKNKFDLVVMFAVIEHIGLKNRRYFLDHLCKSMKKDSFLIITTPTKQAKLFLTAMSKIGLVSTREISEHQCYYDPNELIKVFREFGLELIIKKNFEFWMNSFLVFKKLI